MERIPARVAVVSDQAIFLRGLAGLILSFPETHLVGEARTAAETLQLCQLTEPELLLLSIAGMEVPLAEVISQVHQKWPSIQVVLLMDFEDGSPEWNRYTAQQCYRISPRASEEELKIALDQIWQERTHYQDGHGPTRSSFQHQQEDEQDQDAWEMLALDQAPASERSEEVRGRELVMAGKIQEDILPEKEPALPGWEVAARLKPARETSGDFYDFIPLTEHKLGVVMADVTDKGIGAALFMALSSSLIRTYAVRFPTLPGLVLNAVSERILSDTRGGMFVTAFYGVLEPYTGRVIYANAGHPAGCIIGRHHGHINVDHLNPTGMAMGVSEEAQWKQKVAKLTPGDYLILYTDGITEASNPQGVFFGEERLLDSLLAQIGRSAAEVCDALLDEVHHFVGHVPAQDDIALIVIRRQE